VLASLVLIVDIDAARVECTPVAILGARRIVDEIAKLRGAAPAGFAGVDYLSVLANANQDSSTCFVVAPGIRQRSTESRT
jgi:hypothetical protein